MTAVSVAFAAAASAQAPPVLKPPVSFSTGNAGAAPFGLAVADIDFDRDGTLDVAVVNENTGTVRIFRNRGPSFWANSPQTALQPIGDYVYACGCPPELLAQCRAKKLAFGKFEFASGWDARPDMAITFQGSNVCWFLRNNALPTGTFTNEGCVSLAPLRLPLGLFVTDWDGDGRDDVAIAGWDINLQQPELKVLYGQAGGGWVHSDTVATNQVGSGGYDLDGVNTITASPASQKFLAMTSEGIAKLHVFTPGAGQTFTYYNSFPSVNSRGVTINRLNSGSVYDAATTDFNLSRMRWLSGTQPADFTLNPLIYPCPSNSSPHGIDSGPINPGDTWNDIVCANEGTNNISVFVSVNGAQSFQRYDYDLGLTGVAAPAPKQVLLADLSGDGLLDIIVSDSGADMITVFIREQ